ncbi:hypothetical protein QTA57_15585 [Fontisubflavum oceani]|uniref:hypothetical protein n=1 Tax=Fontisubflavum oceani TaxID=2978973 RepID=UPI0025B4DFFE|nr:hypothetical protein [Fontisubflavum oceani]WJY21180.1 hypothetical protein QTA57_15585 [Fontisubflavum oceani]
MNVANGGETPETKLKQILIASVEAARAEGRAEGYAEGVSSNEAKRQLEGLCKSYVEQGREAEREAACALVDQAREEGRVLGVEQAADEWRSKLDKRSHHKGVIEGKEIGYKDGFAAGKEEGFKAGFKAGQSDTAD